MATDGKTALRIVRKDEKEADAAPKEAAKDAKDAGKDAKAAQPAAQQQRPPRELTAEEKVLRARLDELNEKIRAGVDRLHQIRRAVIDKDKIRSFQANQIVKLRERIREQEVIIKEEARKGEELTKQINETFQHGKDRRKDVFKIKNELTDLLRPYCTAADMRARPARKEEKKDEKKEGEAPAAAAPAAAAPKKAEKEETEYELVTNELEQNIALIDRKIRELELEMGNTTTLKEERALLQKISALRAGKNLAREFDRQLKDTRSPPSVDPLREKLRQAHYEESRAIGLRATLFRRIEEGFAAIEASRKDLPQLLTERNALIEEIRRLVSQTHDERERADEARYKVHKEESERRERELEKESREVKDKIQAQAKERSDREREALERLPFDKEIRTLTELAAWLREEAPPGLTLPAESGAAAAPAAAPEKPKVVVPFKIPAPAKKEAAVEDEDVCGAAGFVMIADKGARSTNAVQQFEAQQQQQRAKAKAMKKGGVVEVDLPAPVVEEKKPEPKKAAPAEKKDKAPAQEKKKTQKLRATVALGKQVMLQSPVKLTTFATRDFANVDVKPPVTYAEIPDVLAAVYKKREEYQAKNAAVLAERKKKQEEAKEEAPAAAAEPAKTD